MRFAALALCLVACSSDPSRAAVTDAAPSDVVLDVAPDVAVPDAPADVAPDAAADVAPVDATAPDVAVADAARDVPRDVAPEADPCGSPNLRTCDVNGHNECVDIESGRVLGGVVVHCGACGVTCAAGEVCAELRCQRL
jgi:hypothetical protein